MPCGTKARTVKLQFYKACYAIRANLASYAISAYIMLLLDSEDRFGAWSTEGCREVVREGNRRVCECTQLAHFGILFVNLIKYGMSVYACHSSCQLLTFRT